MTISAKSKTGCSARENQALSHLVFVCIGLLACVLLSSCGMSGYVAKPLPNPGGDGGGGDDNFIVSDVEVVLKSDNAPADGETANVITVKAMNRFSRPVAGYTPVLNLPAGHNYACQTTDMDGISVCFLYSRSEGQVHATVEDSRLPTSKSVTLQFAEKKPQTPGNAVGGGGVQVSTSPGAVAVAATGETTNPITLKDQTTSITRMITNAIGVLFE